jgi:signal transduction histidine kinase
MEIYEGLNDYRNAFRYQAKFQEMSDSVNAAVKAEKIATLTQELMYENKRAIQKASQDKELAIKESQIKTQKLIKNISIVGLVLIFVFAVIFYIRFKEKRKLSLSLEKTLSELKGTQKQLIQSEKMASLGELTAGIAHEIQNPLNFVNNFSEVSNELIDEMNEELDNGDIKEAKIIASDIKSNLEKINHHGKRADSIVKGMLQHSRASGNKKAPTDINALADEYMRLAYHGLRAKDKSFNAELITDFDESIGKIDIIPQDIGRVILNLLTNAFYAVNEKKKSPLTPKGGNTYKPTVKITTGHSPLTESQLSTSEGGKGGVIITVTDNGNGIPDKVKEKIFQPFFTTKPTGSGTGLGLSLSYDIVKAHDGEMKVESQEGVGTTFSITLPFKINHIS